jgi:hypothetical protein
VPASGRGRTRTLHPHRTAQPAKMPRVIKAASRLNEDGFALGLGAVAVETLEPGGTFPRPFRNKF